MTDQTTQLPVVDSQWEGSDGSIATVTEITVIHGKPNVCYDTTWPGTDRWGVGVSDAGHFTATRTQLADACCDLHNAHCEPPADLCCYDCTEAGHPQHPRGVACVLAPNVSRG